MCYTRTYSDDSVDLCLVVTVVTFILNCHLNRLFQLCNFQQFCVLYFSLLLFVFVLPFHFGMCWKEDQFIWFSSAFSSTHWGVCCVSVLTTFIVYSTKCHTMRLKDFEQFVSCFFSLCIFWCAQVAVFTQSVIYSAIILAAIFFSSLRAESLM